MIGSAIGAIARKIGAEVAKGLGKSTAKKIVAKPGAVRTEPRPFKKATSPMTPASVKTTKGSTRNVKNPTRVSGMTAGRTPAQAARDTAALEKGYQTRMGKASKTIGTRRVKDVGATGAAAGAAGYAAGKRKKKK